jgi:hypothetical protein
MEKWNWQFIMVLLHYVCEVYSGGCIEINNLFSYIHFFLGEEYEIRKDLRLKAFKTYHVIPSQVQLFFF